MKSRVLMFSASMAAALFANAATAQDVAGGISEEGRTAASPTGVNDIVVTAQRRAQSVMQVPLSIQAMTGGQLAQAGIDDVTSLQFTSPGFQADSNGGFVQVFVRGIGNAIFLGADPSVATFIDDVPQIYGNSSNNFVDIERIEILKGAQGGLYGRNATGGVVNIITRQPSTDALAADVRVSFGERDTVKASGYVNVPLGERAAWSVSLDRFVHDAYLKNIASAVPYSAANFPTGSSFGTPEETAAFFNSAQQTPELQTEDFWSARSKLLLKPADDLTITLAGSYSRKNDSEAASFVNLAPGYAQGVLEGLFGLIGVTTDLPTGFLPDADERNWTNAIGGQANNYIRDYSLSGTVTWSAPNVDLTSITAYRNLKAQNRVTNAQVAVPLVLINVDMKRDFFYQELRGVSTFDGPLRVIAGATYLDNNLSGVTEADFLSPALPAGPPTVVDQKIRNWSVYAEVGYDITDHLSLTVSGRYMWEKNTANFTLPVVSTNETIQKKFVPAATISYDLGEGNIYARWARGFKTGGVNVLNSPAFFPNPEADGGIFGPETVDTFEIGVKKSLFDRRVQVTAAAFYNDYKDLQAVAVARPEFPAIQVPVVNAESARTYGAEASLIWQVIDPLTLGVNVGYLNAKYKDFSSVGSAVLGDYDYSGQRMTRAPKWQLSFNADVDQPINNTFRIVSNVLVAHSTKSLLSYSPVPGVLPDLEAPSYWLVNARIGLATIDDAFRISLIADNLTNEVYFSGGTANSAGNQVNLGSRRIIRGEVAFRF